jgi:hypothetical protein
MNHDWRVLREIGKLRSEKIAFVGEGWVQPVKRRRLSRAIEGSESEKTKEKLQEKKTAEEGIYTWGKSKQARAAKGGEGVSNGERLE